MSERISRSLKFHIDSQDYFGTLATVLTLWLEVINFEEPVKRKVISELMFLQEHYKIVKK